MIRMMMIMIRMMINLRYQSIAIFVHFPEDNQDIILLRHIAQCNYYDNVNVDMEMRVNDAITMTMSMLICVNDEVNDDHLNTLLMMISLLSFCTLIKLKNKK